MEHKKYGLPTAIAMIMGIVIGSGIFFKSDNILVFTQGNIFLGVVVFSMAAFAIIFGSLTVSELAARTDEPGGIIAYAEIFCSRRLACGLGWFQTFIYLPTLIAIIGFVSAIYTFMLFGVDASLEQQILLGCAWIVLFFILNILAAKLGGHFQTASTIMKLIPLFVIGIAGFFFGDPAQFTNSISMQTLTDTSWIAAVGPIAFAFDGWILATSVSGEIKNAQRNLPLAMIIAPILTLFIYLLYFVGISIIVGPEQIIASGDEHVYIAAEQIFGAIGSKILVTFVTVSVLGTLNGLILSSIRVPQALAERNYLPKSQLFSSVNPKLDISVPSAFFSLFTAMIWLVVHYLTTKYQMLPNSDISEISITFSYATYLILYYRVFQMAREGKISKVRGYLFPLLATVGSIFIFFGGMMNPLFPIYVTCCLLLIGVSQLYYQKFCANNL